MGNNKERNNKSSFKIILAPIYFIWYIVFGVYVVFYSIFKFIFDIFKYIFGLADESTILTGYAASDTSNVSND